MKQYWYSFKNSKLKFRQEAEYSESFNIPSAIQTVTIKSCFNGLFYDLNAFKIDVTIETIKLNSSADHQSFTQNPGTISDVHFTISTLITNKNIPKVKMVIGIVRITKRGLMKLLSNPNTIATHKAVIGFCTVTPLKKKAATKTDNPVTIVFPIKFFI